MLPIQLDKVGLSMRFSSKQIFIFGLILAAIVTLSVIVVIGIGKSYRLGLSRYAQDNGPGQVTHNVREKIRKIKFQKGDAEGCIEVTPDGAVRIYKTCGQEELTDAYRETDTRNILRLFKQASETDFSEIKTADSCGTYLLTITTESSTKTFCLSDIGSGNGSNGQSGGEEQVISDIIGTIDTIISDIPVPTPTVIQPSTSPTDYIFPDISPTIIPSQTDYPWITPEITPTGEPDKPFTCDFYDALGSKKPYRVSSVVCSTVPQPGQ